MGLVQDGGVVGDTKVSLGLSLGDTPHTLELLPVIQITREAQPTSVWNRVIWRHGIGVGIIAGTAAERQSIALINPADSGTAIRVHSFVIKNDGGATANFEVREGPIPLFVSPATTDWTDFSRDGDPSAVVDTLSQVGVVAGSQIRERHRITLEVGQIQVPATYVLHTLQALIVNPDADNQPFSVVFRFEQFLSDIQR